MYFTSKNIEVRFCEFDQLKTFLREALRRVKSSEIQEPCCLAWDDYLILRAITGGK